MASISPSPISPSGGMPPASSTNSNPDQIADTPSPHSSFPPATSSAPPPQSSPPPLRSPPPETSPPPAPSLSRPPPPTTLPSPPPPTSVVSPPPSSLAAPSPTANSPPPPAPPPPTLSTPPPSRDSPPKAPPAPTITPSPPPPPPPPAISPSPPPPRAPHITAPLSPPPPVGRPPKHFPAPSVSPPAPPDSPSITSPLPASPASPPPVPSVSPSGSPPPSTPLESPPPSTPLGSPPIPSISPAANLVPSPPMPSTSFTSSLPGSPPPTNKLTATATDLSPNTAADSTSSTNSTGLKAGGVAAISGTVGFLALTLVILAVWRFHIRKKRKDRFNLNSATSSPFASSQNSDSIFLRSQYPVKAVRSAAANNYFHSPDGTRGSSKSWFMYQDLFDATGGFSADNLLGEGGFGCVYKGVLDDGRVVAVKQLKAGGGQGEREFRAEVEIISRIHHRHLVSLVGYCISENQRLLVYDYVPNNTLHFHLHAEGKAVMDWASRVKVAAGAARGLAYLHEDCQPRIIHRDIKSTNILLDNNFGARVADFGLAKLALELELHTHVSTRVMGTFGYLAPEYASTGKLTEKSDVFSFGVVLLELITGRKPVDPSQPLGDESLVEWARPMINQALEKEDFRDLVDPRLENHFIAREMFTMIEAAAACVRHLASRRPKMSQVVRALDSIDELADLNNGMKPGQSGIFSSREQSAQIRIFQRMAFRSEDYGSDIYDNSGSSCGS